MWSYNSAVPHCAHFFLGSAYHHCLSYYSMYVADGDGLLDHLLPVCTTESCDKSHLLIFSKWKVGVALSHANTHDIQLYLHSSVPWLVNTQQHSYTIILIFCLYTSFVSYMFSDLHPVHISVEESQRKCFSCNNARRWCVYDKDHKLWVHCG